NGEALNVSGVTGNVGTATLSGTGSNLSVTGTSYTVDQGLAATTGETVSLNGGWSNGLGSTISAGGATLNLGNSNNAWSNAGTITATNSTVNLGGLFTVPGLGTFNRSG